MGLGEFFRDFFGILVEDQEPDPEPDPTHCPKCGRSASEIKPLNGYQFVQCHGWKCTEMIGCVVCLTGGFVPLCQNCKDLDV